MRDKISKIWELIYPYFFAILCGWLVYDLPIETPVILDNRGFSLPNAFGAISGFNTFGAGVMISVLVFTTAPAAGFVAKLERLKLYKTFQRYAKEAIVFGILGGLFCIPLYAAKPQAMTETIMPAISVAAVVFTVGFMFLAHRVSRIFLFWISQN